MRCILCVTQQLLLDLLTDSNETWRVYAVLPWLLQRQLFDFRFDFKPEVGCFSKTGSSKNQNRKSKSIPLESSWVFVMRLLSLFFDFSKLLAARIIFVRVCPYTLTQGAKICKSHQRLPRSKYQKSRIGLLLQNCVVFLSSTFSTSGSDIFNFRFSKNSPLPV